MEKNYTISKRLSQHIYQVELPTSPFQKIILKKVPYSGLTERQKQNLVNEVNYLINIESPHIVKYLSFQSNKKDLCLDIMMQHCEQGNLQDLIKRKRKDGKPINEQTIWTIFYQLVQALNHLHQDQKNQTVIFHRNINPNNVFISKDSEYNFTNIKLGGFSMSKVMNSQEQFASTYLANTYYLSPEQCESGIFSKETDIWALGCLIYELCTLASPFRGKSELQTAKIFQSPQFKLRKVPYSAELNRVIFWCLKCNPRDRPTISQLIGVPQINLKIRQRRIIIKEKSIKRSQANLRVKQQILYNQQKKLKSKLLQQIEAPIELGNLKNISKVEFRYLVD